MSFLDVVERGVLDRVFTLRQRELLILRGHGLIEAALVTVLAKRLQVGARELPVTNFDTLARLALCGSNVDLMLQPVLHVNRLRNVVAHELEPKDLDLLMQEFVATMPPKLADATKRPYQMSLVEAFAAALMVLTYALLALAGTAVEGDVR